MLFGIFGGHSVLKLKRNAEALEERRAEFASIIATWENDHNEDINAAIADRYAVIGNAQRELMALDDLRKAA